MGHITYCYMILKEKKERQGPDFHNFSRFLLGLSVSTRPRHLCGFLARKPFEPGMSEDTSYFRKETLISCRSKLAEYQIVPPWHKREKKLSVYKIIVKN